MSDWTDAFDLLSVAYPRWGGQFAEPRQIEAWGSLVDDIEPTRLLAAVRRIAASSKWPPTVAEIREEAGCDLPGTAERRAAAAAAATEHAAWVAEQERLATERARAALEASGVVTGRVQVAEMLRRVGR
mgnify:CR=1 FL=1